MMNFLSNKQIRSINWGLPAGPLLFLLTYWLFRPEGLPLAGVAVLSVTLWIAIWWITEAVQIEVTSLLPIVLFPLTGALNLSATTASYGHKFIFLFVGGFILAMAIEKWHLHTRIALTIIRLAGTGRKKVLLGFMVSSAFISMWISNTATTIMMLPIAMAVIPKLTRYDKGGTFGKKLILAIAYSASIGGISTLIGTPPNVIMAGIVEKTYGVAITFPQWMLIGLPFTIIMLLLTWLYLSAGIPADNATTADDAKKTLQEEWQSLGAMSKEEKRVGLVFLCTAASWISSSYLLAPLIPAIDDTIIAMVAALILFVVPAGKQGERLLTWQEAVKLPWGVLMLFGGGIAIANGFDSSGLAAWIGHQLTGLQHIHLFLLLLLIIAAVNYLTEITSNLATTAVLLPILIPMAEVMDIHPYLLIVGATMAASCAFMLPVATAPNAIVFGSGMVDMRDMIKAGLRLNLISIVLLSILVYLLLPIVWQIDLTPFPF